jgi:hypothetical protein
VTRLNQNVKKYVSGNSLDIGMTATDEYTGEPFPLTGATLRYEISTGSEPSATAMVAKTIGDGITIVSAAAGTFTITIDGDDTEDMITGDYHHECKLTTAAGKEYTLFRGTISALENQITV